METATMAKRKPGRKDTGTPASETAVIAEDLQLLAKVITAHENIGYAELLSPMLRAPLTTMYHATVGAMKAKKASPYTSLQEAKVGPGSTVRMDPELHRYARVIAAYAEVGISAVLSPLLREPLTARYARVVAEMSREVSGK